MISCNTIKGNSNSTSISIIITGWVSYDKRGIHIVTSYGSSRYLSSQVPEHKLRIWHFNATNIQSNRRNDSIRRKAFRVQIYRFQLLQKSLQIQEKHLNRWRHDKLVNKYNIPRNPRGRISNSNGRKQDRRTKLQFCRPCRSRGWEHETPS